MADEYIERERIEEFFNGIYDCADLTFYPNDHCCTADDCAHCKWRETMNAIKKGIREIPAADVVPVVRCKDCRYCIKEDEWTLWCMSASPACLTTPEDYCSHGKRKEI